MSLIERMSTLQSKLYDSEWDSIVNIQNKQKKLFSQIFEHAWHTVPFYKAHYRDVATSTAIADLPILKRTHIQQAGDNFLSQDIPEYHGDCYSIETSGSTGQTVQIQGTAFTRLFYDAMMLREHAWHQRDFNQVLMAIRWLDRHTGLVPLFQSTWGPPINQYQKTGSSVLMNVITKTEDQIAALLNYKPYYLLTYPSQLAHLIHYCVQHDMTVPSLKEVRTTGETLTAAQISLLKRIWSGVKLTDIYSCCELGSIAQQCPEYLQYHVNAEHIYLEIVDDDHRPCVVGQPGKVLVTSLLNYATPLIRYELGDFASWGEPCPCGRGLPVISRILGRSRNRLILPSGESKFPFLGDRNDFREIADLLITQFQFIQHTLYDIEIKVVTPMHITRAQELKFAKLYQDILGYPFNITISYCDYISAGPTGKFEEFISRV